MAKGTLWELPVPSTALLGDGPKFEKRLGRVIHIQFEYEALDSVEAKTLVFDGVEAYRCTYMTACDDSMLEAYDKLVDRGETDWLASVRAAVSLHGGLTDEIRHLMILFDDGPCYELVCRAFNVKSSS